jgi:hypothetical protein
MSGLSFAWHIEPDTTITQTRIQSIHFFSHRYISRDIKQILLSLQQIHITTRRNIVIPAGAGTPRVSKHHDKGAPSWIPNGTARCRTAGGCDPQGAMQAVNQTKQSNMDFMGIKPDRTLFD